jgi:pimeloyl-ACP methyl ester carboxylesterase
MERKTMLGRVLIAVALAGLHGTLGAEPPAAADQAFEPYAKPSTLAQLADGRSIHFRCVGSGSPTVILTAGIGDWSTSWRQIQPGVSALTRVCTWDRAGFGFSGGSDLPQTIANTTADLWAALRAASIAGPYVLVGHSYGGLESVAFRDRHPEVVAGMVLIDPSFPDQDRRMRQVAPAFSAFMDRSIAGWVSQVGVCRDALVARRTSTSLPDACAGLDAPAGYPDAMSHALGQLDLEPSRWSAKASLLASFTANLTGMAHANRRWGSIPVVVLSATQLEELPPDIPEAARREAPRQFRTWQTEHRRLARFSTRGLHRFVPGAGHYIHRQRPEVVIQAIQEVVIQQRADGR